LSWVAPLSETSEAESNRFDWKAAHALGIHFVAMNIWNHNDALKQYMNKDLFGTQSFSLKPTELRYIIELLPAPKQPVNPNWGSGPTAGTIREPPPLFAPIGR
jgi:hypothetical protein